MLQSNSAIRVLQPLAITYWVAGCNRPTGCDLR